MTLPTPPQAHRPLFEVENDTMYIELLLIKKKKKKLKLKKQMGDSVDNSPSPSVAQQMAGVSSRGRAPSGTLHQFLILYGQFGQLAAQTFVKLQVLGHTAVQAHSLSLRKLCLLVVGGHTLPVASIGHAIVHVRHHFHFQLCRQLLRLHGIHLSVSDGERLLL